MYKTPAQERFEIQTKKQYLSQPDSGYNHVTRREYSVVTWYIFVMFRRMLTWLLINGGWLVGTNLAL